MLNDRLIYVRKCIRTRIYALHSLSFSHAQCICLPILHKLWDCHGLRLKLMKKNRPNHLIEWLGTILLHFLLLNMHSFCCFHMNEEKRTSLSLMTINQKVAQKRCQIFFLSLGKKITKNFSFIGEIWRKSIYL